MESSDNAESPSPPRRDTKASDAESSDDEVLFSYPSRGEFKRKARDSDESNEDDSDDGDKGSGNGSNSDDDDDDDGSAFNSSPEQRRTRTTLLGRANRLATGISAESIDILSSDDENLPAPSPKRRHVPDMAAIEAEAEANVKKVMNTFSADTSPPQSVSSAVDREYQREKKRQLAAASTVNLPGRTASGLAERQAAMLEAAEAAAVASSKAAAERSRGELSRKHVKLRVERSKNQLHYFNTKLSTEVGDIANGCRRQRALLSRDEEGADLSLYYEETLLDGDKSLLDCGITGDVMLRLEVMGEAACFSGPPISLKVRTDGGKTFTVETTMDTTFSAFMESFNAAVGVPPERAGESVFKFDGDNLRTNGTPQTEAMESADLIDAKLPVDLMLGVQASPSELKLVTRPKQKQAVGKKAARVTSSARSTTPAAAAASAVPLGRTRATRSTRATRGSGSGSGSSSAVGGQGPEIVVVD